MEQERQNEEQTVEQKDKPAASGNQLLFRLLGIGYVLWCVWKILKGYLEEGEGKQPVWLLVAGVVLLGGAVWTLVITYKQWKQMKANREDEQDPDEEEPSEE